MNTIDQPAGTLTEDAILAAFALDRELVVDDLHSAVGPTGPEWHVHGFYHGEFFGVNIREASWLGFAVAMVELGTVVYNELVTAVTTVLRRYAKRRDQDIRFAELQDDYRRYLLRLFAESGNTWNDLTDDDRESLLGPNVRAIVMIRVTSPRA